MGNVRILQISDSDPIKNARLVSLPERIHYLEYDVIVINMTIMRGIVAKPGDRDAVLDSLNRLCGFVSRGGNVLLGYNGTVSKIGMPLGPTAHPIFRAIDAYYNQMEELSGTQVTYVGPTQFRELGISLATSATYHCWTSVEGFAPILVTTIDSRPVAQFSRLQGGGGVLLASFDCGVSRQQNYRLGLVELLMNLSADEKHDVPTWVSGVLTATEKQKRSELAKLKEEETRLLDEISRVGGEAQDASEIKKLIYLTQDSLDQYLGKSLSTLGLKCLPGPKGRADWLARWNSTLLVIEVKSKTGVVGEADVRQAAGWANDVAIALAAEDGKKEEKYEELEQYRSIIAQLEFTPDNPPECIQALLICNVYCNTPLQERELEVLAPNAMLRAERMDVSVLTTLQLLVAILSDVPAGDLVKAIIEAKGLVKAWNNWRGLLLS